MDIHWLLQRPQQMTESGKSLLAPLQLRSGDLLTATVLDVEKNNDALLSIGHFKAYARLPLPVVTGQNIQIRVESAGESLRMVMVSKSGRAANGSTGERLAIRLFEPISDRPFLADHWRSLVPGESLQGRITGFEKNGLMLVDFGKFKAFAKIDIPVRQGQTLPLTVVKNDNGITLAVGPKAPKMASAMLPLTTAADVTPDGRTGIAQQTSVASRVHHAQPENQSTSPGKSVAATVGPALPPTAADVTPDGRTGIAQQTSVASRVHHAQPENQSTLPGKSVAATVGPAPPPTAAEMAVLRERIQQMLDGTIQPVKAEAMPLSTPMKGALINLQQALYPASPTGDMTMLVARVRDFIENSGLYFEKRLEHAIRNLQARSASITPAEMARQPVIRDLMVNDLKPNLLILKEFLDRQPIDSQGGDRHMLETLKSVVERTVSNIEQQQFMATEKPVDPDLFLAFSHMMFLTDTHRNARLKVYYAKKGRDDAQKNPRVSLLLDMDRMGTVRTDLWMVGKDLNVTFFVKEEEIKAAIDTDHHRIGEMLKDIFNTVAVSVVVNEKKIAEFDGEDLTLPNRRQVDLTI